MQTKIRITDVKAPKGKIIIQTLKPEEFKADGIIIPNLLKNIQSNRAKIVHIGEMDKDLIYYHDCEIDRYRKCVVKVGDIVFLEFASQINNFEALDENGEVQNYITINPETITSILKI